MACKHLTGQLQAPTASQSVYRDDCTQCFDSIDDPDGLNVCMHCFNGGCARHSTLHHQSRQHPLALNIKRTRKPVKRDEPPQKMSKLAIAAETDADRYDTRTEVRCFECGPLDATQEGLPALVDGILRASTFARQAEVQAWEQEFVPCQHTRNLVQQPARQIQSQDLGQCSLCELKENLWLCLTCGNLGCGRQQYAGLKGNSHSLAHSMETAHPVAVKLGSLTAEGTADVYCYTCNDERVDPDLAAHLAHWGINITDREKTEKSLTEMQIEHNLNYDFSMTSEDGQTLSPVFGPGYTGLKNLGNSCYLASILQCLFAQDAFRQRYFHPNDPPPPTDWPAEDLETQLRKVADGLLSGRYSYPDRDVAVADDSSQPRHQKGLAPAMLKHLVGKGHEEFSTMRQQDAFELLLHLLKLITRSAHPAPLQDPVDSFRFAVEQRLQCLQCKKVRYRVDEQDNVSIPVPARKKASPPGAAAADGSDAPAKDEYEPVALTECLDLFTAPEAVELTCPACGGKAFTKRALFKTLPRTLAVNTRRFRLVNWVPTKLDIPVLVPDGAALDLAAYVAPARPENEELLPDDAAPAAAKFQPNPDAVAQLEAMGFPRPRCEKALHATGNADAEAAMNWLFQHMEDADIDAPVELTDPSAGTGAGSSGGGAAGVNPESIASLGAMGIAEAQARKALRETGGDVNRALDWVFSHPEDPGEAEEAAPAAAAEAPAAAKTLPGFAELPARYNLASIVCHKGASIHAGHYVAFIKKDVPAEEGGATGPQWVLYNDEKVVRGADAAEMKKFAYVYFFERSLG